VARLARMLESRTSMSAGAAIAAMAEQAKMKACEKYMLKLSESGDVFEMVV
jgi:hypothetical protein